VAALLLLGATMLAQQLDARARRQEAEAQRAWARTSAVEADLEAVDEARRGLALQVREVSSDRQALAASLADREGELVDTHLRLEEVQEREARRLAEARQAALALRQQLTSTEAARRGVVEELEVSRGEAASLARRLAAAEAETRRQAEAYRVALAEVTAARDDLSARWRRAEESATAARLEATTMRAAHRAARDRVEELEHRVDQAERARGEVETELSRVRARIAQLAEAVATPAPEATSPTTL
jgi:chromosome segregation ATPase